MTASIAKESLHGRDLKFHRDANQSAGAGTVQLTIITVKFNFTDIILGLCYTAVNYS